MKKLLLFLLFSIIIFSSCKREDLPSPNGKNIELFAETELSSCEAKENVVRNFLSAGQSGNRYWLFKYYIDTTDIFLPLPFLDTITGNTVILSPDGILTEYIGINYEAGPFNTGTFEVANCGETIIFSTNFFTNQVASIEMISPNNLVIYLDTPSGRIRIQGEARNGSI